MIANWCEMMQSAEEIIKILGLKPHPKEGGYFLETYRSSEKISKSDLPERYPCDKNFGTAIYYLLTPGTFSPFHRLPTDELFHFYLGDPVIMIQLHPDGSSNIITLGQDIMNGQQLQVVVPKDSWQGLYLKEGGTFGLMGTTMSPGFDYSDYEEGTREALLEQYPEHFELITRLTYKPK